MDAVAQTNPFPLQLLGKTRPRAQFDEPWISDLQAAEQMTVGPQSRSGPRPAVPTPGPEHDKPAGAAICRAKL
jgi:hypothetical protein